MRLILAYQLLPPPLAPPLIGFLGQKHLSYIKLMSPTYVFWNKIQLDKIAGC